VDPDGRSRLEAIWLKIGRGVPMERVGRASLIAGYGLEGNADRGGSRQLTFLDADAWERATAEIGVELDPGARRANCLLRGIDLASSRERVLRIGVCRVRIHGEARPCGRMDEAADGLRAALTPEWRAGAYGTVIEGGPISVGDPVAWDPRDVPRP